MIATYSALMYHFYCAKFMSLTSIASVLNIVFSVWRIRLLLLGIVSYSNALLTVTNRSWWPLSCVNSLPDDRARRRR